MVAVKLGVGMLVTASSIRVGLAVSPVGGAVPFPDVPPWHWAANAVASDQAAGLVIGYPSTP
jgi:hypothetical protein